MTGYDAGVPRTLFVSDLDGTLLRPDASLGSRTVAVVNEVIASGGLFTFATARSFTRAGPITAALDLHLPAITYGGAVIVDPSTGRAREAVTVPDRAARAVQVSTRASDRVQPILFVMHQGRDRVAWLADRSTIYVDEFLAARVDDPRLLPLRAWDQIDSRQVFSVAVIGERTDVEQLRSRLAVDLAGCSVILSADTYSGDHWLEITHAAATKATAVRQVAAEMGAERIVCFGDNANDLPMFAFADVALAVANASPPVRAAATSVIGSNVDEGVATWLERHVLGGAPPHTPSD